MKMDLISAINKIAITTR